MEVNELSAILDFFAQIVDFVTGLIQSIVQLIQMINQGAATLMIIIAKMPVQYRVIFIALVSYSVLVVILHQGSD